MPLLKDIGVSGVSSDDVQKQIDSIVKQVNDWGRNISNESKTLVIRGDQTTNAIIIGQQEDGSMGILMNDGTNDRFFIGNEA